MKRAVTFLLIAALCISCQWSGKRGTRTDTATSGVAVLVADDCFGNMVQEEVNVFETLNQKASLLTIFTSETEAINLLLRDSIRLAILARELTEAEVQTIKTRNPHLTPRSQRLAIDGIALIVHPSNNDSLVSVDDLHKIMTGQMTTWNALNPASRQGKITVVFDNPNSSTVRFIRDSICKGETLSNDLRSMTDNVSVLDYVARTPNALGVIGVNWINNPNDSTQLSFNQKVRVMEVSRTHPATRANSYKPYPAYLALHRYPLTREVYVVLTDLRGTLPAGFTHFMLGDRGQRIVLKSGLVPATRPLRTIQTKENF
ncbi:phosphate ABC transporter substrate-binding protein [Bacteroidia bacterium]|nr:phosphate ABC transporter substrate-binding protein [Bacteroidia bacterium]